MNDLRHDPEEHAPTLSFSISGSDVISAAMIEYDGRNVTRWDRAIWPDLRTEAEIRRDQVWNMADMITQLMEFAEAATAALSAIAERVEALERREGRSGK